MKDTPLPIPVKAAIRKLGADVKAARRRRRIQTALMAERAMISRTTLHKIETGDPGVSMAHYATVLYVLGMLDRLKDLADIRFDAVGQQLDEENLPQRIRLPKSLDEED